MAKLLLDYSEKVAKESSFSTVNNNLSRKFFAKKRSLKPSKFELNFPNSICESKTFFKTYQSHGVVHQTHRSKQQTQSAGKIDIIPNCKTSLSKLLFSRHNKEQNKPVEIKYSWQDLEHWIPPEKYQQSSTAIQNNISTVDDKKINIKYSWQLIGKSTQTSETNIYINKINQDSVKPTSVHGKLSTIQADDYWIEFLYPHVQKNFSTHKINNRMVYNEYTQTTADKTFQTSLTDCRVKYSWQNLTKPYLHAARNT